MAFVCQLNDPEDLENTYTNNLEQDHFAHHRIKCGLYIQTNVIGCWEGMVGKIDIDFTRSGHLISVRSDYLRRSQQVYKVGSVLGVFGGTCTNQLGSLSSLEKKMGSVTTHLVPVSTSHRIFITQSIGTHNPKSHIFWSQIMASPFLFTQQGKIY